LAVFPLGRLKRSAQLLNPVGWMIRYKPGQPLAWL
jgi:hypothetical protein